MSINPLKLARIAAMALAAAAPVYAQSSPSRPLITGVSHFCVYSSEGAKAEIFYGRDLGAALRSDPENPVGMRFYFSPVQFVEVLPLPKTQASAINRMDHIAFNTADAEKLRTYLGAHGIAVPAKVEYGSDGSEWFQVDDPEGNHVQFVQPPAKPEPVAENPLSNHIIHVGIIVHDRDVEDAFYRQLLGFRPYWHGGRDGKTEWISQQVPDGTDWIEYMVVGGPETRGIPATMSQQTAGVLNHFSLGVFNMENSVDLLYAGDRLAPKDITPKIGLDGKWQLNMIDPDGTRAEVMEFQPAVKPCCSEFTAASPTK